MAVFYVLIIQSLKVPKRGSLTAFVENSPVVAGLYPSQLPRPHFLQAIQPLACLRYPPLAQMFFEFAFDEWNEPKPDLLQAFVNLFTTDDGHKHHFKCFRVPGFSW